ncbi:hypothetical protein M885DRAFT_613346 [Pelagophyceae sp. CCMP2097]|nr:hypothetical protein M885DRAFT_613346 [Pelagophyceae sp. CCMP2097]|mmetsp:Transcript_1778/g.5301  ORF Transcript_1778/g.5301 Transcript_1778/m.5301 type:complete len:361 (+) Transcript_1778:191-1273(+)
MPDGAAGDSGGTELQDHVAELFGAIDLDALLLAGYPAVCRGRAPQLRDTTARQFFADFAVVEADFRVHAHAAHETAAEADATRCRATFGEFSAWLCGAPTEKLPASPDAAWAYCAYQHLELLGAAGRNVEAKLLGGIDAGVFGGALLRRGVGASDATLWLGSAGAHTPAHFDSRACNFVLQGFGRKRWRLWPPGSLPVRRLPFEEATVWAAVEARAAEPPPGGRIVDLGPGDVLFVPKHWWHAVECLDASSGDLSRASLALNVWVPLESDSVDQAREALTRVAATALVSAYEPRDGAWVNAGEALWDAEETLDVAARALGQLDERLAAASPRDLVEALLSPDAINAALAHLLGTKRRRRE